MKDQKVNLSKIKDEVSKILLALKSVQSNLCEILIENDFFNTKKKKSSSHFSHQDVLMLRHISPLIILLSIFFYVLNDNDSLDHKVKLFLEEIFDSNIRDFRTTLEDDEKTINHFISRLNEYKKLIELSKNNLNKRLIMFDSKSKDHKHSLGGSWIKNNIVIKIRGAGSQSVHIRVGIKVDNNSGKFQFTLQDIVNKKDRN